MHFEHIFIKFHSKYRVLWQYPCLSLHSFVKYYSILMIFPRKWPGDNQLQLAPSVVVPWRFSAAQNWITWAKFGIFCHFCIKIGGVVSLLNHQFLSQFSSFFNGISVLNDQRIVFENVIPSIVVPKVTKTPENLLTAAKFWILHIKKNKNYPDSRFGL